MGDERGQATPLLAVAVLLVAAMAVGVARVGLTASDRAKARTAADAAALGAVVEGRAAADELALANGAEVVAFERSGLDVVVTVRVGDAEATARARRQPAVGPGAGTETAPLRWSVPAMPYTGRRVT